MEPKACANIYCANYLLLKSRENVIYYIKTLHNPIIFSGGTFYEFAGIGSDVP